MAADVCEFEHPHPDHPCGRKARPSKRRVATAIRFEEATHETLKETATELGVGVNWLVNRLCEEGLARMDLTNFSLVRPRTKEADRG